MGGGEWIGWQGEGGGKKYVPGFAIVNHESEQINLILLLLPIA